MLRPSLSLLSILLLLAPAASARDEYRLPVVHPPATGKTDLAPVLRYALVDAEGAETELQTSMSMSGMGTWKQTLVHPTPLETGSLRIEYWADPGQVELPFSVSAGLGLR